MDLEKANKLNQLLESLPEGVIVPGSYLSKIGYSSQLVYRYVKFARLINLTCGVYCKLGMKPDWQGVVLGLQRYLNEETHLGGISALNYQGLGHYLPMGSQTIHLFGKKFPNWLDKLELKEKLVCRKLNLFDSHLSESFTEQPTKVRDWQMLMSTPERAILEFIDEIKESDEIFVQAFELMEGLTVLRPALIQKLLEICKKIAVKRTFLYLAEKCAHNWFDKLDIQKVDLGKGKRQIIKGGVLDKKYNITVPQSLAINFENERLF